MKTITECESKHRKGGLLFSLVCAGVIATFMAACAEAPTVTANHNPNWNPVTLGNRAVWEDVPGWGSRPLGLSSDYGDRPYPSSKRFKQNIENMGDASDPLYALHPVTFRYKPEIDPKGVPQFGLVAEDVEKVSPDLVVHDAKGEVYTVRYEAVNAMLLNEFLKEHNKVQTLEATVTKQQKEFESKIAKQELTAAQQQKQIEALTATVQKVSDRLELNKPVPQMVADNR
jgi:LysM repeat protein